VTLTSGTSEYDIPDGIFEQRLEKLEMSIGGVYYEIPRISYRDITKYERAGSTPLPMAYVVIGNKYRLLPSPNAAGTLRLWYLKDPEPMVLQQGRITSINTGSNYILVDGAGTDLSPQSDSLNSYINLVDGSNGTIRVSLQIQSVVGNKITFKTVPTRTSVLGKVIDTAIPTTVERDDYICTVHGSCVPFMKKPLANFLIQYATSEIQRKLGIESPLGEEVKKQLEAQVEHSWVGREQTLRVKKTSNVIGTGKTRGRGYL
jgi:hypothetical protein